MSERNPIPSAVLLAMAISLLSACATWRPPVVESLDELTAVTVTSSRTPIVMSPDTPLDRSLARDYVRMGPIEINRMGSLEYFLWLGISDIDHPAGAGEPVEGYESIVLHIGDEKFPLDLHGWTHSSIGVSEPVYKKLFSTSADAYYQVTLDQVRMLTEMDAIKIQTSGANSEELVSWYRQSAAQDDLAEFIQAVEQ